MAYLSKHEYFLREQAAARRMAENAEIETLTEAQHDALATLCAVRHELHSTPRVGEVLFNGEAADHSRLWDIIDTETQDNKTLSALVAVGLPALDWSCDPVEYDTSFCWPEVYGTRITEDDRDEAIAALYDLSEAYNSAVEDYLRKIDEEYGTHYAPTGALRNF